LVILHDFVETPQTFLAIDFSIAKKLAACQ
jgi:hypothetical protein